MKYSAILIVIFCSCSKQQSVSTFSGNLPIVSTSTPKTALVGQGIISNVRCELTSVSGSLEFQGFNINEVTNRQYNLSAKALYKNWRSDVALPVVWTLDTTLSIKPTTTGQYVLHFYNATQLVKSDTVEVR